VFYLNLSRLKRLRQLGALRRNKLGKIGQKIRRG